MTVTGDVGTQGADLGHTRLLTFQAWVLRVGWYNYALAHPNLVPFPLIDRSPCQDPFFDAFADPQQRRPVVSGLCRARYMRNFQVGDRYIYIARIAPGVARRLGLDHPRGPLYFGVAAMRVTKVWESHTEAASEFAPRQYVALPTPTPYPPNLAFEDHPVAAAARVCSIVFDDDDRPHLPADADDRMWRRHYLGYRTRQIRNHLRAAECEFEVADGGKCLQLLPAEAPVITPDWWGGDQMNVLGMQIPEPVAQRFRTAIATSRAGA
jgi:hypothetical protein